MSQGALIADEQTVLQATKPALVGTLSDVDVKSTTLKMSRDTKRTTTKLTKIVYRFTKRAFDLVFGLIGSLFIIPLAIFIKLAYVLTGDFGSIFFSQKRIGKNGREFNFYKFRTMVKDADQKLVELLKQEPYKSEWRKYQKLKNDPRISKIGKLLRKTSLDEFPQFINILKGDMSLIGPRPLVKGELDLHGGDHELYEAVRPGLSSWWAANGRSETDYETRLEQEYYYVENQSLRLDLICIAKTAKSVLLRKGAN
ncbi:sugar transferase [Candidatus Saccharibacteria bacterium]|nr:sugar transferase [Candidatus Saccharibacteria bacterium]